MAGWNGSGTFTKTHTWVDDQANGIKIRADRHDQNDTDFTNGINNCITKDGQNSPSADLPMNGQKHTNVAKADALNQYATVEQVIDNELIYYTASGTDTYTITPIPAISTYAAGQEFVVKFTNGNTGASTLNVNALGAKNILIDGSITLSAGKIPAGSILKLVYDGTQFQPIGLDVLPIPQANKYGSLVCQNNTDDGFDLITTQGTTGQALLSSGSDALPTFGTLDIAAGGTGEVTASAAFNALKQTATTSATGVVELGVKSEAEAATDSSLVLAIDQLVNHPGVAKATGQFNGTGGTGSKTVNANFGISSATKTTTGTYTVTLSNAMNTPYVIQITASATGGSSDAICSLDRGVTPTSTTFSFDIRNAGGGLYDSDYICIAVFGDRA